MKKFLTIAITALVMFSACDQSILNVSAVPSDIDTITAEGLQADTSFTLLGSAGTFGADFADWGAGFTDATHQAKYSGTTDAEGTIQIDFDGGTATADLLSSFKLANDAGWGLQVGVDGDGNIVLNDGGSGNIEVLTMDGYAPDGGVYDVTLTPGEKPTAVKQ